MTEHYVGKTTRITRIFTLEDIEVFSAVSNDFHSSQDDTLSGRRAVHPALLAATANSIVNNSLPGPTAAILEQSFNYLNPVFVNDRMTFTAEIIALQSKKKLAIIQISCQNQDNLKVLEGETVVYIPDMEGVEG